MRRIRKTLWAAVLVSTVSAGTWAWRWNASPLATEVETVRASRQTLHRTVVATGVIRPVVGAEIEVGSRVSGRVLDLPVQVGDTVAAGDLLAQLDASELEARIDQVRADLEVTRAELAQAGSEATRRRRLVAEGILPLLQLEIADRDVAVTTARVGNAEARLRAAEINHGYTRIEAPIHGVIAAVSTREGETVAASFASPTFVTIIDLDRLEVRAFVDETDIGRVFVGQSATFTVDTYPGLEIPATVTAIQPKAALQNNVVNYVVILDFESDRSAVLRPEMTAHVRLALERREDALTVPRNAVHRRDGRLFVSVQRDGAWAEQEVEGGWRTDGVVEIVAGLAVGEVLQVYSQE